jgi:hypothetical protein
LRLPIQKLRGLKKRRVEKLVESVATVSVATLGDTIAFRVKYFFFSLGNSEQNPKQPIY